MLGTEATVMHALIVYESIFGSTRAISHAIAGGLRMKMMPVDLVGIEDAPAALGVVPANVSLLIVGAPSHTLGLSSPKTRTAAAARAAWPMAVADVGLREWLDALPTASYFRDVLAFETRLRVRSTPGSASKAAAKRLRKRGYRMVWPVQTFYVANLTGTLVEGELQRAHMWGRWLGVGQKTEASH
jgi:hypothetical protein